MRWIVAGLVTLALALFVTVWWQGRAGPTGYLYGTTTAEAEAGYCLAVVERISEITRGQGDPRLEAHLDEQVAFWHLRVGQSGGSGRVALGRHSSAPGVNEGAHLHLAIQDCALRAVSFYGHRFPSFD